MKPAQSDIPQAHCKRCGTCCMKGGPALHSEDLTLIEQNTLSRDQLITLRKGELVYKPDSDTPQAVQCELIKINGSGRQWQCQFYDEAGNGCGIYADRPLSCRELQCWDTSAVELLIEKNTLSRLDIVAENEPIYQIILDHERNCPCPDLASIKRSLENKEPIKLGDLEKLINKDIEIRNGAVKNLKISLAEELFYFGRPLFQLLQQIGVLVREQEGTLKLFQNE